MNVCGYCRARLNDQVISPSLSAALQAVHNNSLLALAMTDTAKIILVIVTTLVVIYRPSELLIARNDIFTSALKLFFSFFAASAQVCFSAAGCNSADAVTATDADDCCINKDDGLYYLDGTDCIQCISKWLTKCICSKCIIWSFNDILIYAAFGWLQSTFEGEEQSIAHTVQGGYSKGDGALSTVDVFVELVEDPEAMFHPSKFIGLQCIHTETQISYTHSRNG